MRSCWAAAGVILAAGAGLLTASETGRAEGEAARDVGSRLELFADDWLIERMSGVRLTLHPPTPHEVAVRFDKPWEGVDAAYVTVMKDGDRYRMYYRGNPPDLPEVTCYAESKDGVTWTRPSLGLFPFKGSKDNNIVWAGPG